MGNKTTAENRVTLTMFGEEYELEASLGAMKIYADTFRGFVEKPYTGNMMEDMLQIMREVEGDESMMFGLAPQIYGLAWAMARATGSMKQSWDEFADAVSHEAINYFDFAEAYGAIIQKLGAATFRLPERLRDVIKPDEAEETEDEGADS